MQPRPETIDDVRRLIEATPVAGTPAERRAAFVRLAGPQPLAETVDLGRLDGLAIGAGPALLWFHGGGLVFGSPESHAMMAMAIAATGIRVILPRYRLAPEVQWPAMLDDAVAAAEAVRAAGPVVAGGVSAGGHLALALALSRPDLVSGLAVLSPNTDRTGTGPTRSAVARDAMNDDATDTMLADIALGGAKRKDPLVSPAFADLSGLPPLHIEVGSDEVLLGDALALERKAAIDGAVAALHVTPGLFHMAALWPHAIPEARVQLTRIGAFVRETAGG